MSQLPPIPEGSGILPIAENRIAHGSTPEILDGSYIPEAPVLDDALEHTYRRVLARAVALASAALFVVAFTAASLIHNLELPRTLSIAALVFRLTFIAQIFFTSLCTRYVQKLPTAAAAILLFAYSALCGIEFSVLLSPTTIAVAFSCAAIMYAAAALWAIKRQADLARLIVPIYMIFGGAAILVAINFLLHTPNLTWSISAILIAAFAVLLLINAQQIRDLYQDIDGDNAEGWKSSTIGALLLIVNLLNLYLMVCSVFSIKEED